MPPDSTLTLLRAAQARLHTVAHVGLLVPWANTTVEAEMPRLGGDSTVFHYARLVPQGRTTAVDDDFLSGLRDAAPGAVAQLAALPLQCTFMACTSAGFTASGPTGADTAFDAVVATLTELQVSRIALATPYPRELTAREAEAFHGQGFHVAAHACLDQADGYAEVSEAEVRALIRGLAPTTMADAQALVLSCTNWPTLGLLAELEGVLGVPVLSSNAAMACHAALRARAGTTA